MQRSAPRGRQVRRILGKCGKSDSDARTGVPRLELSGNTEDDDDQTYVIRDHFIMDTIATELPIVKNHAAPGHPGRISEIGFVQNASVENLNIETVPSNPFLPAQRKRGDPVQRRWNGNYRSRHERLREGLVFRVLRGPGYGSSRSPVPTGPHLLQRYPSGRSADPLAFLHGVPPKPY